MSSHHPTFKGLLSSSAVEQRAWLLVPTKQGVVGQLCGMCVGLGQNLSQKHQSEKPEKRPFAPLR